MKIHHGLISADSHVVTEPNAFLSRMSKRKFGDRIPQIKQVDNKGTKVERWVVNGRAFAYARRMQLPGRDGRSKS